jgi:hypothetical protein
MREEGRVARAKERRKLEVACSRTQTHERAGVDVEDDALGRGLDDLGRRGGEAVEPPPHAPHERLWGRHREQSGGQLGERPRQVHEPARGDERAHRGKRGLRGQASPEPAIDEHRETGLASRLTLSRVSGWTEGREDPHRILRQGAREGSEARPPACDRKETPDESRCVRGLAEPEG